MIPGKGKSDSGNDVSSRWFPLQKLAIPAPVRLFCFHHAGGHAGVFRPWINTLAPLVEVCPVQLPGRLARVKETLHTDIATLMPELAPAISSRLDRPSILFGHSMGGLVAFELIRELRRRRLREPMALIVSAHRAPQLPNPNPRRADLPQGELIEMLRKIGGTPEEVLEHRELVDLLLPTIRGDFALCESYRYEHDAPLSCPIFALGGDRDPLVSPDEIRAWDVQTTSRMESQILPGGHVFLLESPAVFQSHLNRILGSLLK
jgi:medium-chain acyl-[acyl-carrier-protein] hydrolase